MHSMKYTNNQIWAEKIRIIKIEGRLGNEKNNKSKKKMKAYFMEKFFIVIE